MDYRLLALDIDGTLLDSKGALRPRVAAAVSKASTNGLKVCLVSGRRPRSMRRFALELDLSHPMVSFNGGVVSYPDTLETLYTVRIKRDLIQQTLQLWWDENIPTFAYRNSAQPPDVYYDRETTWPAQLAYISYEGPNVHRVHCLATDTDWEPLRVVVAGSEALTKRAACLAEPLSACHELRILHTRNYDGTWYYEIYPSSATKSNGLEFLCDHFGISPAQIVAVGDHINDLDMIEFAGLGVAMGNAQPSVKAKADLIIGDHDEDGLADFIEHQLLAGLLPKAGRLGS